MTNTFREKLNFWEHFLGTKKKKRLLVELHTLGLLLKILCILQENESVLGQIF